MAKEFFHYDPLLGITEYFDYDEENNRAIIHREQDVSPYLEAAHDMRISKVSDQEAKKDDYFALYAIIPPIVQIQLLNKFPSSELHYGRCLL